METQQVGPRHAAIVEAQDLVTETGPNPEGLFVAEGLWEHGLLVDAGTRVKSFVYCPELIRGNGAWSMARHMSARAEGSYIVSGRVFARLSDRDAPDGLLSVCRLPVWGLGDIRPKDDCTIVVLDGLRTPGNIGTIIRSADGAGVDAVVQVNRRVRMGNRKVIRSSEGSILRLPVIDATEGELGAWMAMHGFTAYLTDPHADTEYFKHTYEGRVAIVAGDERHGIGRGLRGYGDKRLVSIPMLGACDSLNVGIATSIVLYEAAVRRRFQGAGGGLRVYSANSNIP